MTIQAILIKQFITSTYKTGEDNKSFEIKKNSTLICASDYNERH